ncbi:MAG: DUF2202 domain-containing protein [Phycisphaerales bacterium]|nr:DUF2202 domain-containing protein [Phycisphaerales bacterium]
MKKQAMIGVGFASVLVLLAGTSFARGPGGGCGGGCTSTADASADSSVAALSSEARAELLKMRQEEKLARDVYRALHERWGADVFKISNSEQRHMDAMKAMLDRFSIQDPIVDDTPGVFTDKVFSDLYHELVDAGSGSVLDALKVGAKIEELDLVDLRAARAEAGDAVLDRVYGNLERATRNHLRAFAAQIEANKGVYAAVHLPQEEFDAIADSEFERGNGGGAGQGQRKNAEQSREGCGRGGCGG